MADFISKERLSAVEPIVSIVGMTEDGDLLIEDRNNARFSLRRELLDGFPFPGQPVVGVVAASPAVQTVDAGKIEWVDESFHWDGRIDPNTKPKKTRARAKKPK